MKTIEVRKGLINDREQSTIDLIKSTLDNPPKDGFTYDEMKKRLRVEDAMGKIGAASPGTDELKDEQLELEDADFETLSKAAKEMRWVSRAPIILQYMSNFY